RIRGRAGSPDRRHRRARALRYDDHARSPVSRGRIPPKRVLRRAARLRVDGLGRRARLRSVRREIQVKTSDLLVDVFLILGISCQFVCCLGVLVFGNVFDRLHFAGAGTTLGPLLIGAAVLVRQTTSAAGITTMVIMVAVVVLGPALVIATARAARRLDYGELGATERERSPG